MFEDDSQPRILVFGIPIDAEYRELARLWWRDVRTWVEHGPRELTPEDRARNEFVQALADELRRQGVPHPITTAWDCVGTPDAKEFAKKLKPGQPLGDLTQAAVLRQFRPLIYSRLRHFGAVENKDAVSAANLAVLEALAKYNPAIDDHAGNKVLATVSHRSLHSSLPS